MTLRRGRVRQLLGIVRLRLWLRLRLLASRIPAHPRLDLHGGGPVRADHDERE